MKKICIGISLAAAIAVLSASPAGAAEEGAVVPPSNSAATQYTETFPTSGGDKKTDEDSHHSPSKVLGKHNAQKLKEQGPEGQAAAEAAAATAPSPVATPEPEPEPATEEAHKGAGAGGSNHDGNAGPPKHGGTGAPNKAASNPPPAPESSGSSGLGSALAQALGLSSNGPSGSLLPIVILATLLCSAAYLWRQRRQSE